jgi:hypothetical protein
MWVKIKETLDTKEFRNQDTGGELTLKKVYTDTAGNIWWEITNLFLLPKIRILAAQKISQLYQVGLSVDDIENHINAMKNLLRSEDKEKYDKAMQAMLNFEDNYRNATNASRQMSSLVCIYYLLNDERIDAFDMAIQDHKINILMVDMDAQAFFLTKQIDRTETYGTALNALSKTASLINADTLEAIHLKSTEQSVQSDQFN